MPQTPIPFAILVTALMGCIPITTAADGASPIAPVPQTARPLPLSAVRLTGGALKQVQDLDASFLLSLDPERLLARFRKQAGLPSAVEGYHGWDGDGRSLSGHFCGHYLSGVSLMYAATGDGRFRERAQRIVAGLAAVQAAHGDGYCGALQDGKQRFAEVAKGDIRSQGFDLNGLWAPFYVHHKVFAGLRDAWRHTGDRTALEVEARFAGWVASIVVGLDDQQMQQVLGCEHGGMNEVLADLAIDTGDRRWLDLARRFEHRAIVQPLKEGHDRLAGVHANTQVPKLMGSVALHRAGGDAADLAAALAFWDFVVNRHSYATGGHGRNEYFIDPARLADLIDGRTSESCNVYNMLKLARGLFALRPEPRFADFHERALLNHVLASIDPADGRTCYMVPVGRGVQREYQDNAGSCTCCAGSGMESHALHGDGVYYEDGHRLWVNLHVPSRAVWAAKGVTLDCTGGLPEGEDAELRIATKASTAFALVLRRPLWADDGYAVSCNGQAVPVPAGGRSVVIDRTWNDGDAVRVRLPRRFAVERIAGTVERSAVLWGPLVLAGDLGPEQGFKPWEVGAVPTLAASGRDPREWLAPVAGQPGRFRTVGVGREQEVEMEPLHRLHRRSYTCYWDFCTPDGWASIAKRLAAEREERRRIETMTVAFVQPGEMQPERDFHFAGDRTWTDRVLGRPCRRAHGWFAFRMPAGTDEELSLLVTCWQDEWHDRRQRILVDGTVIATQDVKARREASFADIAFPIPAELTRGKREVTVRFEAPDKGETPGVFGVRLVRRTPVSVR